jgi:Ca2+/Na+ antiporter
MLLMTGFFGLFVFILFLAHNINNAIKSGVFITIAIILFYALVMFSENILERQEGVLYFSILLNLLFFLNKSNQQKVKVKKKPKDSLTAIIDNRPA